MPSISSNTSVRRCAHPSITVVLGAVVCLGFCLAAKAQPPATPGGEAQNADAPDSVKPAPDSVKPAPDSVKPAPDSVKKAPVPQKPPAPRLNREYGQLQIPEDEQPYLRQRATIQKYLRAGQIPSGEEAKFIDYYRKYALARWTFTDRLNQVADFRRELRNELIISHKPGRNNVAHDQLSKLVLHFMSICTDPKTLARPEYNFSPVTRFNAIMMIGELNQEEPGPGAAQAKPLPAALPVLLDRATDPLQIDAVRLGALLGLRRHCRLMPSNAQVPGGISRVMADLLQAKESERVRSPEGQAWLRLVAVQTFADLKGKPNTPAVAKEMLKVIAETDSPDFLRYAAASALGSLDYRNAAGLEMNVLLEALGLLAIEVCDEERQRLRDEMESEKKPTPSSYGSYGSGGSDMAMEAPSDYEDMSEYGYGSMSASSTDTKEDRQIERVRRRLKDGMTAVLIGLGKKSKGLRRGEQPSGVSYMAGKDEAKTQNVEAFSDAIHEFFKVIDTKDRDNNDKQIEAKPLDEEIAKVRQELVDALDLIDVDAPPSPEFEPLPEKKRAGAMGSGYDGTYMQ